MFIVSRLPRKIITGALHNWQADFAVSVAALSICVAWLITDRVIVCFGTKDGSLGGYRLDGWSVKRGAKRNQKVWRLTTQDSKEFKSGSCSCCFLVFDFNCNKPHGSLWRTTSRLKVLKNDTMQPKGCGLRVSGCFW